jgi:D-alanine-D-alanine ligase
VNSAASFLSGVNFDKYKVTLMYITKEGKWYKGPVLEKEEEVPEEKLYLNTENGFNGEESGYAILEQPDSVAFPLLHGPNGEDGSVQGMLEVMQVPYIGPRVVPCATGMDKIISKQLFLQAGIDQIPFQPVLLEEWGKEQQKVVDRCIHSLSFPMYVKPANLGSSIGITEAHSEEELIEGIQTAFKYDRRVVVEQGVKAREVEIALLGNEDIRTTLIGEVVKDPGFFDYEDKYIKKEYEEKYPAELTEEQERKITEEAVKGFKVLDGNGMARCDFFVTEEGEVYLNEINLIPGFSSESIFAKLWNQSGLSYKELIEEIIQLGLDRSRVKKELTNVEHD